ncbi:MAG: HAMP domain-containing histidine kinase, partial [Caldilinea sp.]|nr:HAMP domain-containing histidine kinase [Caldilinea sp.]
LAAAGGDLSHQVPVQTSDELGALASAFNYMVGEVRTMLEQQRAFVANASHELRTPLTNIKLRIEAVRTLGDEDTEITTRYLAEIESEADRLTRLANQLLDLAHLESGGVLTPAEATDIAPALHQTAEIMRLRAQRAGV